jgi:hypothetical protein
VVIGFDETGIKPLAAEAAAAARFEDLMLEMQNPRGPTKLRPVLGWVLRDLTSRILAQRGVFVLSAYADQPWGSVQIASTYLWQRDIERQFVDPDEPRVFFIAVTPELKKEVVEAGRSGLLGVDPTSLFPDIGGFAANNRCDQDVPLFPS